MLAIQLQKNSLYRKNSWSQESLKRNLLNVWNEKCVQVYYSSNITGNVAKSKYF